ncbi:hypothetical protein ACFRFU_29005 [Streptomyces sp. NPDC056704]|uniref:hypothetical protein n=1 Tax=Streptomyces sp. NPDC056704 TaxID=3345917 RepID=UPI0036B26B63
MTRSRRLAAVALSGAVALSCAVLTAPAHAAPSVDTPVATVQLSSSLPTEIDYTWAGSSGFRYRLPENSGTLQWADYPDVTPPAHAGPDDLTTGTDVITSVSGATVTQQHRSTGVTATVTVPSARRTGPPPAGACSPRTPRAPRTCCAPPPTAPPPIFR